MFLVFSAILYRDLIRYPLGSGKLHSSWILAFSISILLGISTETLQYLLASLNRTANLIDLLFDGIGSASGIITVWLIKRKPDPGF
jgi:VanZ family protein